MKLAIALISATIPLLFAPSASANPATSQAQIDEAVVEVCGIISANPTEEGMFDAVTGLEGRGFDEMDAALTLISAGHHGCPQHEGMMIAIMTAVADDEICGREPA